MKEEKKNEVIENNRKISLLFSENEKILKSEGYNPPCINYVVPRERRVNIPTGYIRTRDDFCKKYHLLELVESRNVRNNICYALQLSDYYNFMFNRFYVWGSIQSMLCKQAFVNIVSIIEALILESANRINKYCKNCSCINRCKKNITRNDRVNMKNAANKLVELGILNLDTEEVQRLSEMYDLRNKIHIRLNEENEFLDNAYNMELCKEVIIMLQKIDELLWTEATSFYNSCMGFESK